MPFDLYSTLTSDLDIDDECRTVSVIPQLSPSDYAKVKNVLTRIGGVWSSRSECFEFAKSPSALINRVLSVGTRQLNKFQFYPTPDDLFDYMKDHTPLSFLGASRERLKVLEPSCGEGGLIERLHTFGVVEGRCFDVKGYDIDPLNVIFCQEAGFDVQEADFLTVEPVCEFDAAIMNPPFIKDQFIKHIRHAQKFLKDDGLLISVVPTAWIAGHAESDDRRWLLEQAQIHSTVELQKDSFFAPYTFKNVSIPTTIICLESCSRAERILSSDRYLSSAIESFNFYIDNNSELWDQLHELKMQRDVSQDVVTKQIHELVDSVLTSKSDEAIHIVRRFAKQYETELMNTWFPEFNQSRNPNKLPLIQMDLLDNLMAA